ncbi:MAG: hypothetical protein AAF206_29015 [Bacteroidota bacterium]
MNRILILTLFLMGGMLSAQTIQWKGVVQARKDLTQSSLSIPINSIGETSFAQSLIPFRFQEGPLHTSEHFIPAFARDNPSGYSYLCRLELKAENTMAIPLWFRAENGREGALFPGGNVYLQIKALRF